MNAGQCETRIPLTVTDIHGTSVTMHLLVRFDSLKNKYSTTKKTEEWITLIKLWHRGKRLCIYQENVWYTTLHYSDPWESILKTYISVRNDLLKRDSSPEVEQQLVDINEKMNECTNAHEQHLIKEVYKLIKMICEMGVIWRWSLSFDLRPETQHMCELGRFLSEECGLSCVV